MNSLEDVELKKMYSEYTYNTKRVDSKLNIIVDNVLEALKKYIKLSGKKAFHFNSFTLKRTHKVTDWGNYYIFTLKAKEKSRLFKKLCLKVELFDAHEKEITRFDCNYLLDLQAVYLALCSRVKELIAIENQRIEDKKMFIEVCGEFNAL